MCDGVNGARLNARLRSDARGSEHMATEPGISVKQGQLRIYLGYAPGVGTTSALLSEGLRRAKRGADVVVARAQARDRAHPAALLARHEVIPLAKVAYRGVVADEMDL